jgi:hypothetical protein
MTRKCDTENPKPRGTDSRDECWTCGSIPGETCPWSACPKGLSRPEDTVERCGDCGDITSPEEGEDEDSETTATGMDGATLTMRGGRWVDEPASVPVTRAEHAAIVARVAELENTLRAQRAQYQRLLGVEDDVEAAVKAERKRIVVLLRSGATGMDEATNASCSAAWARAADLIEAGDC